MASNRPGSDEDFPGAIYHNDVYPLIDPIAHYEAQTYRGKVVFITGASRGIGAETALQYARAGASLALVSRNQDTLNLMKEEILKTCPSTRILTFAVDVTHTREIGDAISETVAAFGQLDVVIANAGKVSVWNKPLIEKDPDEWWSVAEVIIRGSFNTLFFSIPHLLKSNGYAIVISSRAAQTRVLLASDYCVSKHALGRLVEQVHLEYPDLKLFALHPGSIQTKMIEEARPGYSGATDTLGLPAATMLYLTAGKADWLVGRYVSSNWDLGEIEEKWKAKVLEQGGLVSKLHIPV